MNILKTEFRGERGSLFFLALKVGFLTVVTLGIYWFWAKTRIRRWYGIAIRPGGMPLEYSGTGAEKFAGFLIALSVLMILSVAGYAGVAGLLTAMSPEAGALAVAVFPLLWVVIVVFFFFFARYRGWRYTLSRTAWRGLRFGMSPGAIGYAWRGTLYAALTVVSGFLLLPLATFQMEKFITNRCWYGNARFTQHGSALGLFGPILPFVVSFWSGVGLLVYFMAVNGSTDFTAASQQGWAFGAGLVLLWLSALFMLYYRVASIRVMAALKTLGDGVEFDLWPRTRSVLWHYLIGSFIVGFLSLFATLAFSAVLFGVAMALGQTGGGLGAITSDPFGVFGFMVLPIMLFYAVMLYAFTQVFVYCPIIQQAAMTLEIHQPELLGHIRQRTRDEQADADGFAQALDAGAPI